MLGPVDADKKVNIHANRCLRITDYWRNPFANL
jgi:hypothetical protein